MKSEKRLKRVAVLIKLYKEMISSNKEWLKTHKAPSYKDEIKEVKARTEILKLIIKNLKWAVGKNVKRIESLID